MGKESDVKSSCTKRPTFSFSSQSSHSLHAYFLPCTRSRGLVLIVWFGNLTFCVHTVRITGPHSVQLKIELVLMDLTITMFYFFYKGVYLHFSNP
jgi:hypothetical protein